jgi:hypothetical protein
LFVQPVSDEKPDEYTVDLSSIGKAAVGFTYKVHMDEVGPISSGPLLLKIRWKQQGDKMGLIIDYSLNPTYGEQMQFHNLVLLAFATGPKPVGCQSSPPCTLYKEKSLVVWKLGSVSLNQAGQKVRCRLDGSDGGMYLFHG